MVISENPPRSIFRRRFSVAWIGLALSIIAAAGMFWAYSSVQGKPIDPGSHSQRETAFLGKALVAPIAGLLTAFALIAFAVGLGLFIEGLRRRLNVTIPAITVVLCALSFGLFAALWFNW